MNSRPPNVDLFPPLDALEAVLWPGLALLVFVASAVIVDLVIVMATRYRLVDLPNRRSAHALPTARGGGVAIVITMAAAATAAAFRWPDMSLPIMLGTLLPALVIGFVGVIDDMQPLKATLRLLIHIAVAVAITWFLGPLRRLALPGLPEIDLGAAAWPITVLWIVGLTNAYNFMDGIDGMAALGAVVAGLSIAAIAMAVWVPPLMVLGAFLAASAGGFLVFNWQPARVFMGDVGSAFLGTFFAAMPLLFPEQQRGFVAVPIVMALWPYIYDPLLSVLRRAANGHNPLEPHREFLFHRLVRSGVPHARVSLLYGVLAGLGGLAGLAMVSPRVPLVLRTAAPVVPILLAAALTYGIERRCARVGLAPAGGAEHSPKPA
ncbi:MAG: glycosyltransferase family 4 protein [Planctomycetia bacterium]|nr:glycosyltransferase family 4 protein [Planctomycetia bacterium]